MSPPKRGESSDIERLLLALHDDTSDEKDVVNAETVGAAAKNASAIVRENCIVYYRGRASH